MQAEPEPVFVDLFKEPRNQFLRIDSWTPVYKYGFRSVWSSYGRASKGMQLRLFGRDDCSSTVHIMEDAVVELCKRYSSTWVDVRFCPWLKYCSSNIEHLYLT
jgi:hypothetical protein